jgi:hypothetical protein
MHIVIFDESSVLFSLLIPEPADWIFWKPLDRLAATEIQKGIQVPLIAHCFWKKAWMLS